MTSDNIHAGRVSRKSRRSNHHEIDADKVAKLVRLLASDRDGEVLAAVAALRRTLSAGGADINDLAVTVVAGVKNSKQQQPTKWAPPAPDTSYWESMARWAHFHRQHLSTADRAYVAEVLLGQHFDCGRADAGMMWSLRNIVAKIEAAQHADRW